MAKQVKVYSGSQWEPLAVTLPDLSNYSTTTQMNTAISSNAEGMVLISDTSLTGTTVTISSIPQTYKHLRIVLRKPTPATNGSALQMRMNSDSTANRHAVTLFTSNQNTGFSATSYQITHGQDNNPNNAENVIDLFDYTNTTTWKYGTSLGFNSESTNFDILPYILFYNQTAAITSLQFFYSSGNFSSGNLLLYGVR